MQRQPKRGLARLLLSIRAAVPTPLPTLELRRRRSCCCCCCCCYIEACDDRVLASRSIDRSTRILLLPLRKFVWVCVCVWARHTSSSSSSLNHPLLLLAKQNTKTSGTTWPRGSSSARRHRPCEQPGRGPNCSSSSSSSGGAFRGVWAKSIEGAAFACPSHSPATLSSARTGRAMMMMMMVARHAGPAGRLTPERRMEVLQSGGELSGWCEVTGQDAVEKTYTFTTFSEAWGWMTRVALVAEKVRGWVGWVGGWAGGFDWVDGWVSGWREGKGGKGRGGLSWHHYHPTR
jgi:hypothetical protein